MGGERQGVPGDVTRLNRFNEQSPILLICMLQVVLDQPTAGCPNQALICVCITQLLCHPDRLGDELLVIPFDGSRSQISKTNIQMGLENHVHGFDHTQILSFCLHEGPNKCILRREDLPWTPN